MKELDTRALTDPQSSRAGIALALAAALLWGTTGTAQSFAPVTLAPVWVGALRLVLAALFFIAIYKLRAIARVGNSRKVPQDVPLTSLRADAIVDRRGRSLQACALAAAVAIAAYNLCFFAGVRASGVAVGTAVAIGSGPIWAGLIQRVVLGQALAPAWWAGTALAVAGGVTMVLGGQALSSVPLSGLLLCLGAGLAYASYALFNKRLVLAWSPARVNALVFGWAAVLSCAAAPLFSPWLPPSASAWGVLLWLGVIATGVSYLLFTSALRTISGPTGVALALGEPVTAFALAVLVVGERPGWVALAGLALVLVGLAQVIRAELRGGSSRS